MRFKSKASANPVSGKGILFVWEWPSSLHACLKGEGRVSEEILYSVCLPGHQSNVQKLHRHGLTLPKALPLTLSHQGSESQTCTYYIHMYVYVYMLLYVPYSLFQINRGLYKNKTSHGRKVIYFSERIETSFLKEGDRGLNLYG